MEQLILKQYKLLYPSEQRLRKLGFRQLKNTDEDVWKYSFSVYKHEQTSLIDCVLSVDLPTGNVQINVYSNGGIYSPFYNNYYGNHEPILNIINSNILHEFKKLNIKEKGKKHAKNDNNKRV